MAMIERASYVPRGGSSWPFLTLFGALVAHFRARAAERRMLRLSDRMLRDIGVSRLDLEARDPRPPSRGEVGERR